MILSDLQKLDVCYFDEIKLQGYTSTKKEEIETKQDKPEIIKRNDIIKQKFKVSFKFLTKVKYLERIEKDNHFQKSNKFWIKNSEMKHERLLQLPISNRTFGRTDLPKSAGKHKPRTNISIAVKCWVY